MNHLNTFSRLSRGYGTWDGIAKRDAAPAEVDIADFFSLNNLHLPKIDAGYKRPSDPSILYGQKSILENKPFKLPVVNQVSKMPTPKAMPKTYTTRKGALLLYAEDYFLPGSPKPKKRRKIKKSSASKLKTLTDLRDFILNYKRNGGDPLFLALLQKRLSGSHDKRVRPGFSPKRYIATVGRSLQEETWNKLAQSGSFKDPALQTYNPFLPPVHSDGTFCDLFPDKPQPYSTMSLPPISPSSSMLDSSWIFYKNGMSTGAASMISINSEEYAPSSRAMSPAESLNDRLSEVEPVQAKKDYRYALLDPKQKEELLSHMLVQRTLGSVDSDFQGWPSNFNMEDTFASEQDPAPSYHSSASSKKKSKGSLKSASLSSIPRLPPIQSAGARLSSADEHEYTKDRSPHSSSLPHREAAVNHIGETSVSDAAEKSDNGSLGNENITSTDVVGDALDPSGIELDLSEDGSQWGDALAQVMDLQSQEGSDEETAEAALVDGSGSGDGAGRVSASQAQQEEPTQTRDHIDSRESDESIDITGQQPEETAADIIRQSRASLGQSSLASFTGEQRSSVLRKESVEASVTDSSHDVTGGVAGRSTNDVNGSVGENRDDLEGEVTERSHKDSASQKGSDNVAAGSTFSASSSSLSINEDHGPSPEPPPPITFEKLQDEARVVASRVLNRPQSGAVFIEDARAAIMMWADRLSSLLGPPPKDPRTSSAAPQRSFAPAQNATVADGSLAAPVRKRKVSRSAGPSLAALRQALLISGGEIPGIEALKNMPPVPTRRASKPGSKMNSGVSHGHTYYEPLKDGESRSNRDSGSPGPTRSIMTERLSNSDLQMEIFNYVTNDEDVFEEDMALVIENEDEEEDEEFRAALHAVVTDLKQNVATEGKIERPRRTSKPKSPPKATAEKSKTPPFQVTRPKEEKPPPGLKEKPLPVAKKGKTAKKDVKPKKEAKKGAKGTGKAKAKKEKPEETYKESDESSEIQSILENDSKETVTEPSKEDTDEAPEPSIRVDSETGEHEYTVSVTPSEADSFVTRSTYSEVSTSKGSSSPAVSTTTTIMEQPRLVPRIPEPQPNEDDENEARAKEEARKEAEMAKQREKEARATKRTEERAAAAEKRRQEVERKRREREEAKRKQIEETERLERVRVEAEEEMKRREEERRRMREEKEQERKRKEEDELNRERQTQAKLEREKRMREEFERKKQELVAQRKLEEEIRKEQEKIDRELEEASRREEEERIKNMEESERLVLLEKMRREEEELRKRLEEQRLREEEERRALEEQKRLRDEALALLRQKKIKRQLFISGILREMQYLGLGQRMTRAFTFSYYDLLPWNFLQTRATSPMKEMLDDLKRNLPPTIMEEDEENDD